MKETKKAPNFTVAVMTETGEQPKSQIISLGFEREDGVANGLQLSGSLPDMALMAVGIVESVGKALKDKQGNIATAAFICMIGEALHNGAGDEAIKMASMMLDPEKMLGALGKMLSKEGALDDLVEEIMEEED